MRPQALTVEITGRRTPDERACPAAAADRSDHDVHVTTTRSARALRARYRPTAYGSG
jgi:hypothetical protein